MSNVTSLLGGTVTTSGTSAFYADGDQITLFWNVQGPITGTSPTIQFFASEADPSDNITVIGMTASSLVITGTAVDQLQFTFRHSPVILVSWIVTGDSVSFGNVSLSIASGNTGIMTIGSISSATTDTVVSGSIANNGDTVQISTVGLNSVGLVASGIWTGSIAIEASVNGTIWTSTTAIEISSGIPAVAFSSPSSYQINCAGLNAIRVRAPSVITGTSNINFRGSGAVSSVMLDNPLPGGINTIGKIDQGTGGASAWKVDGSAVTQPVSGTVTTISARPTTNTTTSIASSATNIILLASNASRLGSTLFNDSSSMLYIKLGSAATLTDFTIKIFPQSYYEIPFGFTGSINGFWISANGFARVSELT